MVIHGGELFFVIGCISSALGDVVQRLALCICAAKLGSLFYKANPYARPPPRPSLDATAAPLHPLAGFQVLEFSSLAPLAGLGTTGARLARQREGGRSWFCA